MEYRYFEHDYFGKCKIIGEFKNIALIETPKDGFEKYIVATGFSIEKRNWRFGHYFKDYNKAIIACTLLLCE